MVEKKPNPAAAELGADGNGDRDPSVTQIAGNGDRLEASGDLSLDGNGDRLD
jgi:hypothetical protein